MHDQSAFFNWCIQVTQDANLAFEPLAVEASHRRFYRLQSNTKPNRRWVAMDSPPDLEHNQQFLVMAEVFINHGIPVPTIIDTDLPQGFVLMTDLGDLDFSNAYASPLKEAALHAAVDTLIRLQGGESRRIPA